MRSPARLSAQEGLTLTELMIALAMMSVLLVAVVNYVGKTRSDLLKQESSAVLSNISARISANLRTSVGSARLLMADYGGNPDFSDYRLWVRARIAAKAPNTPQPADFTLPALVHNARTAPLRSITPTVQARWGNELLFVAHLQPLTLTVQYGVTSVAHTLSVDRVQFVYLYPALVPVGAGGLGQGLRLLEWRSQPFVLYGSISDSSGARLAATCEALVQAGHAWAFDLASASQFDQAWYEIRDSGSPLLAPTPSGGGLEQSHWAFVDEYDYVAHFSSRPGQDHGRVNRASNQTAAGPARFLLAFNTVDPDSNPTRKVRELIGPGQSYRVPAHAQPDREGALGFPGGFEVAIVGRPHAREVVLRHVVMVIGATDPNRPAGSRMALEGLNFISVKNEH